MELGAWALMPAILPEESQLGASSDTLVHLCVTLLLRSSVTHNYMHTYLSLLLKHSGPLCWSVLGHCMCVCVCVPVSDTPLCVNTMAVIDVASCPLGELCL